jgi:hypothetical protein
MAVDPVNRTLRPDEGTVRDALLGILEERGLTPQRGWVSVRLVNGSGPWAGMYVIMISYPAARTELAGTLRRITGGRAEKETAGVWVLTRLEARQLCAGSFSEVQHQ